MQDLAANTPWNALERFPGYETAYYVLKSRKVVYGVFPRTSLYVIVSCTLSGSSQTLNISITTSLNARYAPVY